MGVALLSLGLIMVLAGAALAIAGVVVGVGEVCNLAFRRITRGRDRADTTRSDS